MTRRTTLVALLSAAVFAAVVVTVSDDEPAADRATKATTTSPTEKGRTDVADPTTGASLPDDRPAPDGALVVDPTGPPGSARTIANALDLAEPGDTIVIRTGTYRESLTVDVPVTIQAASGGADVVLDGTEAVDDWTFDEATGTWTTPWTTEFDHSPTYTRGAPDNTEEFWRFLHPDRPMAAHPDQVFVDGEALRQASSLDDLGEGSFFHDEDGDRLHLHDDPADREITASARQRALFITADDVTITGLAVAGYAPSVPDLGAIVVSGDRATIADVAVSDSATQGVHVSGIDVTLTDVTVLRSGMLGLHANQADGLTVDGLLTQANNAEGFNHSPVSGGAKITRTRDVSITRSRALDNDGPGLWFDESVDGITVVRNDVTGNAGHGITLELSARAVVAGNVIEHNGGMGIKVNDTADVEIWNNVITGPGRGIAVLQDDRRPCCDPGRDPRRPADDPTMTWRNGAITIANNVIARGNGRGDARGNCLVCVEDFTGERAGDAMIERLDGNAYSRPADDDPSWLVVWSRGRGDPATFTTLDEFRRATGVERQGIESVGPTRAGGLDHDGAVPIPADIAELLQVAAEFRYRGRP